MEKYTRYVTMGLRDGKLVRIIARRGYTPDDIIRQTLEAASPKPFLNPLANQQRRFDRLYLMTVGPDGNYGQSTHLKLQEIVSPPPTPAFALVDVEAIF